MYKVLILNDDLLYTLFLERCKKFQLLLINNYAIPYSKGGTKSFNYY